MKKIRNKAKGFTLMELLIAIAIVAILAVIAIPNYLHYVKKSQFSEIVQTADTLKVAVASCAHKLGTVTGCNSGAQGIPAAITGSTAANSLVAGIAVANGAITVTPQAKNGFVAGDTYVLTPTLNANNEVTWAATGGACTKDYASC